jgi:uracil-DNA glycosylase family 4
MSEPSLYDEAREIVASAREILMELEEEGVDAIQPAQLPEPLHEPVTPGAAGAESRATTTVRADRANVDGAGNPATPAMREDHASVDGPGDRPPAAESARRVPAPGPGIETAHDDVASPRSTDEPSKPQIHRTELASVPDWGANPTLETVQEQLGDCKRCGLCERRNRIVFGSGNPDADLMFIGEGPGEQEDIQGLPFVGHAGDLLTQMIEKGIETPRADVYICNIVKCRPPGNRNPLPDEIAACRPFLDGQIDAVRPKVIVSLGKPASGLLLGRNVAITRERGTWQSYRGIPLMPTFHPAFLLRQYSLENRRRVWGDLKQAIARTRE